MPRQVRRRRRAAVLLITGALLLAGCGGDGGDTGGPGEDPNQPPDEPVTIRMGWVPTASGTEQISLMINEPELSPNRGTWYDLEISEFPGTPPILQGLAAGSLDAGSLGSLTAANGLAQGADLVITAEYFQEHPDWGETTWLVGKDSGINTAADLEGKTVGVNSVGSFVDYVADSYLREQGLEANRDYQKAEIPFPQMQDALASGQIDVGVFLPVFLTRAEPTGEFKRLFGGTDVLDQLIVLLQTFRREFVEEHRVAVQKFLEDFVTMSQYIAKPENRQAVLESFEKTSEVPVERAEKFLLTKEDFLRVENGAVDVELLQQNWDFFREQGAFDAELKVEDYIVPDLRPDQE